jgi:hypothetical protein
MVGAEYLRKQAQTCLEWSRTCIDLATATRLRLMADEFMAKAAELEVVSPQGSTSESIDHEQHSSPTPAPGPFKTRSDAS